MIRSRVFINDTPLAEAKAKLPMAMASAKYAITVLLSGLLLQLSVFDAQAQSNVRTVTCAGFINGVQSAASLEYYPGSTWSNPRVAGRIQNPAANYLFQGELFGGTEGFVALVNPSTGERIDRVWIGVSLLGFALRTEDGAVYMFRCTG